MEIALMQVTRCHAMIYLRITSFFAIWSTFHPMTFRCVKELRPFSSGLLQSLLQRMNSSNFIRTFWTHDSEQTDLTLPIFQGQDIIIPAAFDIT
jgi:hypothetical protein